MTWLYEVALGIVIGALLGYVARRTMKFCERKGLIDRQSFVAQYISLAVLSIGAYKLQLIFFMEDGSSYASFCKHRYHDSARK